MKSDTQFMEVLEATSRTFFVPISRLPERLKEAVSSAYLCMRAIDEVEDHPGLEPAVRATLLREISGAFESADGSLSAEKFTSLFTRHQAVLPEVTVKLVEWAALAPDTIAHRIWDATATMAHRMAHWSEASWRIRSVEDLDRYTYAVAGSVGLLLSDLWAWYDGTHTNRHEAVGFGRALQSVNMVRNRDEDLSRNVDFYPAGWTNMDMFSYCRRNLELADRYTASLPQGAILDFCRLPLLLAHATLDALEQGRSKLTREEVLKIVN